jgi:hypothetical protein
MSETLNSFHTKASSYSSSKTENHYQIAISLDGRFVVTFDTGYNSFPFFLILFYLLELI